jgi:NitT/TauT family transport system substrate-binding protein
VIAFAVGPFDALGAGEAGRNRIPVRVITPPELSENPANSYVILKSRTEELRPVLEKFLRAWAKGTAAGQVDRQVVAALCREAVPEQWEVEEGGQFLLNFAVTQSNKPRTDKFGGLRPDVWAGIQGPMVKFKVIEKEIDPATFLDDSFIAAANDWTMDEVKAATDKWRAENPDKIK